MNKLLILATIGFSLTSAVADARGFRAPPVWSADFEPLQRLPVPRRRRFPSAAHDGGPASERKPTPQLGRPGVEYGAIQ